MHKKKLRPPVKIHGGKYYLSSWIIEHFPAGYEEMTYLEPFCGAASVFLNKEPSKEEAINDVNLGIIQIMRVLRDEPGDFIGRIKRIKYSEGTFKRALKRSKEEEYKDYMEHAVTEFVLRRMSRGGLKKAFAWSNRTRGGQPGDVNAWETIIEQLPIVSDRLKGVYIFNKSAFNVIKAFNDPNTLIYCDPPYLDSTRTTPDAYEDELDADQHIELAGLIKQFKGKAIISGYSSPLYRRLFSEWRCKRKKIANHASQSKSKATKTECIWLNF
tara:strand:+ start:2905 stop:3717 length:813 start_codon:yes stop_codon:yes gene_type:complete